MKIEFLNHASVKIKNKEVTLLKDPWYQGNAFHKGWTLLEEFTNNQINSLLADVTHIWISHEHPDHFSILFYKTFLYRLKKNNVVILFQKTNDQRVKKFFVKIALTFQELEFDQPTEIGKEFNVTCFKDGFYDSGLLVEADGKKILNLNDCNITTAARADEVFKVTGECNVLLTQFSYAAWKGGKANIGWRKDAAAQKLDTVQLQVEKFKPEFLIPFASFVYFSNENNSYLNDGVNTPRDVVNKLSKLDVSVVVMKPWDIFSGQYNSSTVNRAVDFWDLKFSSVPEMHVNKFDLIAINDLSEMFGVYKARVFQNNSRKFMLFINMVSPVKAFKPINIHLTDLDKTVCIDIFASGLRGINTEPHLCMSSESLKFIFANTFGFDTLTVNGCFEEGSKGGFSLATRTFAIENLNNIGINMTPFFVFRIDVIMLFLSLLRKVNNKLL